MQSPPDLARLREGPIVHVRLGPGGRPLGAAATARVAATTAEVWGVLSDIERFARYMPMVSNARRRGDDVTFELKFKVGFFSAGFEFTAHATLDPEKQIELRWTHGEPRDIVLRFTLMPLPPEDASVENEKQSDKSCIVTIDTSFDVESLGWLVKFFLKHHPEIQHGIFPGVSLVLHDSLRRALGR